MSSTHLILGRGLWFGATKYTQAQWVNLCLQSAQWGMQWVHPKVADGGTIWYDSAGLTMLKSVAEAHGLKIAPYNYCYGNKFNALTLEAEITGHLGTVFGAVCPDIEVEWENQPGWATQFGQTLRKHYSGPVFPTTFANFAPNQHPIPILVMNKWADGFLPQVYFAEWEPNTAAHAISFVYPQWLERATAAQQGGKPLVPLLPIIETGNNVPVVEVENWLKKMYHYGYCGFWYHDTYAPYAAAVKACPLPALPGTPAPPKAVEPTPPVIVAPHPVAHPIPTPTSTHPASAPTTPVPVPVKTPIVPPGDDATSTGVASSPTAGVEPVVESQPTVETPVVTTNPVPVPPTTISSPASHASGATTVIPEVPPALPAPPPPPMKTAKGSPFEGLARMIPEYQEVTDRELSILWRSKSTQIPWDPDHPLCVYWGNYVQSHRDEYLGAPIVPIAQANVDGEDFEYLMCDSGRKLVYFPAAPTDTKVFLL